MEATVYTSFEEKAMAYSYTRDMLAQFPLAESFWKVSTKEELLSLINALSNLEHPCLFRGLNESKYKLYTSLQRAYLDGKINSSLSPKDFMRHEIDKTREALNGLLPKYYKALHIVDTDFTYLSFLQHYGAPTPFLDFTESFNKALFFAVDGLKYDDHNPNNELNDFISLYWFEKKEESELKNITELLAGWYTNALDSALQWQGNDRSIRINIDNLKIENVLSWSSIQNRGNGLSEFSLCYIDEVRESFKRVYLPNEIEYYQGYCMGQARKGSLTSDIKDKLIDRYHIFIRQNAKLTNLNEVAQDGSFIMYNNIDVTIPLEEYWTSPQNPYSRTIPFMYCANIHKSLTPYLIKYLKSEGIYKESIYPELKTVAKQAFEATREDTV